MERKNKYCIIRVPKKGTSPVKSTMWSNNSAAPFLLTGFLGLKAVHHWISLPFFIIFLSIISGNGMLFFLIWNEHSLHEPMYYFWAGRYRSWDDANYNAHNPGCPVAGLEGNCPECLFHSILLHSHTGYCRIKYLAC